MKQHEILTICIGLGMFVIMFLTPALISAWDSWRDRQDRKLRQ
jgi:hypothetical protein